MRQLLDNDTLLNGICWHLECMQISASAIDGIRTPANVFQMRMQYSLYLTNLLSAIDLMKDNCENFLQELQATLHYEESSGSEVLGYIRQLRNGVIHRGLDPTAAGSVANGLTCAIAPPNVTDGKGDRHYRAPTDLLRDLFIHCEIRVKQLIKRYLNAHIESVDREPPEETLKTVIKSLDTISQMPDWAKDMARQSLTPEMMCQVRDHRIKTLEDLLGSQAGWQIEV
ncbi:hypothetical protein [Rhizobium tumorigenes]|uniref:hypothetical protein n=1 Tax=Rhizobium tumorigenes TaxID=2041385 RepID=UPI00241C1BF0|nr:hypothetical protein [Rhizobium tumorigenes]WFS00935.1 hypothetical protein PR016_17910 [Rhizobium tumorigenes]